MERRKLEILNNFKKINDEKSAIENYLINIAKEVEYCTDILNNGNNEDLKKSKYLLKTQTYALRLLEKLSEIGYELEIFTEDNKPPESLISNSISRCNSTCDEELSEAGSMDISKLKEQVQKIEKMNHTTNQVIDYVAKFYDTSNSLNGCNIEEIPSKLEKINNIAVEPTELHKENESESYIPINNNNNVKNSNRDCYVVRTEQNHPAIENSDSDLDIIEIEEAKALCEDRSSSTSTIETTSSSSTCGDSTNSSSKSSDQYTAIKKIQEAKLYDRRQELLKQIPPGYMPDIALKPLLNENGEVPLNKTKYLNIDCKTRKKRKRRNDTTLDYFGEIKDFVSPDENEEVVFCHIESPSEFYVYGSKSITLNELISEKIYKHCHNSPCPFMTKVEAKAKLGNYCIAFSTKYNYWYRVEILDWFLSDLGQKVDDVLVSYVDFGDKARVSFTNLRPLTKELSNIPRIAIRCHFPLLFPPESTPDCLLTEWPQSAIDALYNLSGLYENKEVVFRIEYCEKVGDSVSIDLCDINSKEQITVGQLLIDLQLAIQIINDLPDIEEDEGLYNFLQDADEFGQADSLVAAVQGYDAKDETRICKFTLRGEVCYKGDRCPFSHVPLREGGFTSDKVLINMEAINSIYIPEIGSRVSILITGFINICHFYVQIIRNPTSMTNYSIDLQLYNLIEVMNNIDVMKTYAPFKIWPAVGEIVVVKHWATKKWLRGKVRHISYNDQGEPKLIQVFFVDFGEIVDVTCDKIKQINEDFLHLPFQAVECNLSDVEQNPEVTKSDAYKFFQENCCFRNFIGTVLSRTEPLQLSVSTYKGVVMSEILKQCGMAVDKTEDCNVADSCTFRLG